MSEIKLKRLERYEIKENMLIVYCSEYTPKLVCRVNNIKKSPNTDMLSYELYRAIPDSYKADRLGMATGERYLFKVNSVPEKFILPKKDWDIK